MYERIKSALRRPESGGILGADSSGAVVAFHFDATGITSVNQYVPDVAALNRVIADWFQQGVAFAGFVHAHAGGASELSWADLEYAERIKSACQMESLLMLLYLPATGAFYEYVV